MLIGISSILWIVTTVFVILIAIYLTIYYNFAQFKLSNKVNNNVKSDTLKLLFVTLSGKIGVGSISGVAISIIVGGKGTILWIWLSSIILSIFTYIEVKTGIKYKKKINDTIIGGPLIYIKEEYKSRLLSNIYIFLIVITYLFAFILIQSNTIILSIKNCININEIIILLLLIIIILKSITDGFKTISKIIMYLFPIMAISYILIGIYVFINNINQMPTILEEVIKQSTNIKSLLTIPFIIGFQRSIFSNEIGVGTTSMIISMSDSNNYQKEAFIQMLGMYFISLIVCTISAMIILTTNYDKLSIININSIEIINYSFNYHFGHYGKIISTIIISIFAFSTIITSYYYGNISLNYLFNIKNNKIPKIIVIIVVILSNYINCSNIWSIVDIVIALTTLINVYVLFRIRKKIRSI